MLVIILTFNECGFNHTCYEPVLPLILIGCADAIVSVTIQELVWFSIPKKQFGTAISMVRSVQSLGITVGSIIYGIVFDNI